MNIGLKLWSTNSDAYFNEAQKLYKQGYFDYIELYVVPDTLDCIEKWNTLNNTLNIPFSLHAPHFAHGINLAKKEYERYNKEIFNQVGEYYKELNARYIVVHSGIDGNIQETVRQLQDINLPNVLIENKPYEALANKMNGKFCRGATIEEIKFVIENVSCGFCLDIGHCICSANSQGFEPYTYLEEFNKLGPTSYHFSDNFIDNKYDKHLHFGAGHYDFKKISSIIDKSKNIAIETQKNSKENLDDFVEDVCFLQGVIK